METAEKIKALMKKPGKAVVGGEATAAVKASLAAPRLREILEEQLKKLFDESDMQTFGVHKRTLQLLREKNNSKGSDATASEQTMPEEPHKDHRQRWFWQKAGFAQGARRKPASRKGPKMVYNGLKPVYSLQK